MTILIVLAFSGIAIITARTSIKEKKFKELVIAGAWLLLGFILALLVNAKVPIPSPINAFRGLLDMLNLHY